MLTPTSPVVDCPPCPQCQVPTAAVVTRYTSRVDPPQHVADPCGHPLRNDQLSTLAWVPQA